MSWNWRTSLVLAGVVCAAAVIYTARLDRVPSFLSTDETAFALQAHSIATTARDTHGRLLPVYFQVFENVWFHPALVYALAPILAVVPPLPWAVRSATVVIALCDVVLVFVLARRLGASSAGAVAASALLALTPAHLLHGRLACDYLFPIPCVLAWFILFVDATRSDSTWRFVASGAALGLGLYTYIASLVTMPMCLALSYVTLFASGERRIRPYALMSLGFALLMLPVVIYLAAVPAVYAGFVSRYGGTSVNLDVLHHPGSFFSASTVVDRWPIYRSFFEWPFLFERAETHVMSSTYQSGVFLNGMKFLLPLGIFQLLWNRRTPFAGLAVALFVFAPVTASVIPEKYAIDRALLLIATGALIGGFGVDWLLARRPWFVMWPARAFCAWLSVSMLLQFNAFYREYLTTYPIRAAFWFDGNHPGAFEPLVRQHPKDDRRFIYLSTALPRIKDHWTLYLIAQRRQDLLKRTIYFTQEDLRLAGVPPGTVLLTGTDDPVERSFRQLPAVEVVERITNPDGSAAFTIFQRTAWRGSYPFDGTYSVRLDVTCTPGPNASCVPLATNASCPSDDAIVVANHLAVDRCNYLDQALVTDEGRVTAMSIYRIPITGTFATSGSFRLSGSGESDGSRYTLTFTLTKRR